MSAVITNIDDLEFVWRAASDGFSAGIDFKVWLANSVIELRAELQEAQERSNASAEIERYWQQTAEQERSNAAEQRERAEQLRAIVSEQARQLDEARNVISAYRALPTGPKGYTSMPLFDLHNAADEWLAANPAEQALQLATARGLIDQSCSDAVAIVNMSDGYVHEMAEHLANQLGAWLAANPAPEPQP